LNNNSGQYDFYFPWENLFLPIIGCGGGVCRIAPIQPGIQWHSVFCKALKMKEKPQDLDRMMLMGEQRFRYSPNPLLRSGLILVGGNRTWKSEEPITQIMQMFYSKWLGAMDKREAFRLAQQELKKKYKEPYYWAGFVMVD